MRKLIEILLPDLYGYSKEYRKLAKFRFLYTAEDMKYKRSDSSKKYVKVKKEKIAPLLRGIHQ